MKRGGQFVNFFRLSRTLLLQACLVFERCMPSTFNTLGNPAASMPGAREMHASNLSPSCCKHAWCKRDARQQDLAFLLQSSLVSEIHASKLSPSCCNQAWCLKAACRLPLTHLSVQLHSCPLKERYHKAQTQLKATLPTRNSCRLAGWSCARPTCAELQIRGWAARPWACAGGVGWRSSCLGPSCGRYGLTQCTSCHS